MSKDILDRNNLENSEYKENTKDENAKSISEKPEIIDIRSSQISDAQEKIDSQVTSNSDKNSDQNIEKQLDSEPSIDKAKIDEIGRNDFTKEYAASEDIEIGSEKHQQIKSLRDEFERIEEQLGILIDDIDSYQDPKNLKKFIESLKNRIAEKREMIDVQVARNEAEESMHKGKSNREDKDDNNFSILDGILNAATQEANEMASDIDEINQNKGLLKDEKDVDKTESKEIEVDESIKKYESIIESEAKKINVSNLDDSTINENISKSNESIDANIKGLDAEATNKAQNISNTNNHESHSASLAGHEDSSKTAKITKEILDKSSEKSSEQKDINKKNEEKIESKINQLSSGVSSNFDLNMIKNTLKGAAAITKSDVATKPDATPQKSYKEAQQKIQAENKKYAESMLPYHDKKNEKINYKK